MKFCTECGSPLNGSTNFCPNCGCNLKNITKNNENNDTISKNTLTNTGTLILDKDVIQNEINSNLENDFDQKDEYIPDSSEIRNDYIPQSEDIHNDEYDNGYYDDEYYDDEYYEDEYYDDEYYDNEDISEQSETTNNKETSIQNLLNEKLDFLKDKRNKTIAIAVAAIIIVGVIFPFTYKQINSPSKIASKFEKAIDNKDAKALAKISDSVNGDLEITEETVQPFIDYCSENTDYTENIKKQILEQSKKPAKLSDGESQTDAVVLAESGGLFNRAVISIKPLVVNIESAAKGATVSISGKNLGTISDANVSQKFGPIVPGKHKLVGSFESSFAGNITEESDLDLIIQSEDSYPLFNDHKSVNIKGNDPEAIIYVDGKSSNIKIRDAESFFPVTEKTELYAIGDKDGKKLESPKIKVKKQKYIQLNTNGKASVDSDIDFESNGTPIMNRTVAEGLLKNSAQSFFNKIPNAVNNNDPTLLGDYIIKGSDLEDDIKDFIENHNEDGNRLSISGFKYTFKFNGDLSAGTLNANESYNVQSSNGESKTENFKYIYDFKYNKNLNSYQFSSRREE